jgi:uncharacterized protein involved in propanediol utilization
MYALLAACTPTYNWRDVRFEGANLTALLPCKPDRATRELPIAGQMRQVHMMGCEAGGAMFTVAYAQLANEQEALALLPAWKAASRANHARHVQQGMQVFEAAVFEKSDAAKQTKLNQEVLDTFFGGFRLGAPS